MKENLETFQKLRLKYLNNQKNKKRTPKISNKLYQGMCSFKCTRIIDSRLASVFLKYLKNLSHPVLLLLF